MLGLKDFYHLPVVEKLIAEIARDQPGLIIVAGYDAYKSAAVEKVNLLPGGCSAVFDILLQYLLSENPETRAVVIDSNKTAFRMPKQIKRRVRHLPVEPTQTYSDQIRQASRTLPSLIVVDHLDAQNATSALETTYRGIRVLTHIDTLLWGTDVLQQFEELCTPGTPVGGPVWVISVKRVQALCPHCKRSIPINPFQLEYFASRNPDLELLSEEFHSTSQFFAAGRCEKCRLTGRLGDVAVFDFARVPTFSDISVQDPSHQKLPLEAYMLSLAAEGVLAFDDVLCFERQQLVGIAHLLRASETSLAEIKQTLHQRLTELEAANRVLVQRTQVLFSLEDISQSLITSEDLDELAARVCKKASELCGADRAVLYFFHQDGAETGRENAEILAVHGWNPDSVHRQVNLDPMIIQASVPASFNQFPPGLQPSALTAESIPVLRTGIRLPLIANNKQVGLMIVHSTQKPHFVPGEIALLQTFANQAALAIQRTSMIQELRTNILQLQAAQAELVEKERMDRELELAQQVQQSMLPHTFPTDSMFHFAALNRPARQVGGDFYDVFELDEQRLAVIIADVSDKGIAAAFHMALARSLMHAEAQRQHSPRSTLENVNRLLIELSEPDRFISVFYAVIEKDSQRMTYARAGHDRPFLLRDSTLQKLGGTGAVLGVLESGELLLSEETIQLFPGDRLILYTDGLTDIVNATGTFYGSGRLESLICELASLPLAELCPTMFSALSQYQGEIEQFDDMTMLVIELANVISS